MRNILIFGNSGSGKSTRAQALHGSDSLAHLDLDTLAWKPGDIPERQSLAASGADILGFIADNEGWVIEGCYADLLAIAMPHANEMLYLNPPTDICIAHARQRPWEPHKYPSQAAQDRNLPMLIEWIAQYSSRDDDVSERAHRALFERFTGSKELLTADY